MQAGKNWFSLYVCCGILINPFKNRRQAGLKCSKVKCLFIHYSSRHMKKENNDNNNNNNNNKNRP